MRELNYSPTNMLKEITVFGRILKYLFLLLAAAAVLALSGCEQYTVRTLSPVDIHKKEQISALNSSDPSRETQQFLRLEFLAKQYEKNPASVIEILHRRINRSPDPATIFAAAELSLLEGRRTFDKDPEQAISHYLKSAELAYDYLTEKEELDFQKTLKPSYLFMQLIYNRAVARFVAIQQTIDNKWKDRLVFDALGTSYEITVKKSGPALWNANHFDKLIPVNQIEMKGLTNQYFDRGVGAALVGLVENLEGHPIFDEYSSKDLVAQPVTAIIAFEKPVRTRNRWSRKAELSFYNPLLTSTASLDGRIVPLEADYSTPLGVLLANIKAKDRDVWEVFEVTAEIEETGIYMLEPYRDDQIPVVMVHGLMSYPATWVQMFNDLRGDPGIRSKYQFWFFLYPTGLPILYSASLLREELKGIQAKFDPEGKNPNFNKMVIAGHSMGGLLSKLMVQDSGSKYWDKTFNKPPGQLSLSQDNKEFIEKILIFDKLDFVDRVVFLAVPHRGSKEADSFIAQLGSAFITFPQEIEKLRKELRPEDVTEEAMDILDKVPNGIMQLSPTSPDIEAIASTPLYPGIKYHSIIGIGNSEKGPGSTDGLVVYESSHLDIVESEKLIQSNHDVHKHPLGISEVKRILRLHDSETMVGKK